MEGRDGAVVARRRERGRRLRRRPDADADAREDVAQLGPRGRLVPATAAAARAAGPLVQDHTLALGADADTEVERPAVIRQRADEERAGRQRRHQATFSLPDTGCCA